MTDEQAALIAAACQVDRYEFGLKAPEVTLELATTYLAWLRAGAPLTHAGTAE
jgi:hypothetical protein